VKSNIGLKWGYVLCNYLFINEISSVGQKFVTSSGFIPMYLMRLFYSGLKKLEMSEIRELSGHSACCCIWINMNVYCPICPSISIIDRCCIFAVQCIALLCHYLIVTDIFCYDTIYMYDVDNSNMGKSAAVSLSILPSLLMLLTLLLILLLSYTCYYGYFCYSCFLCYHYCLLWKLYDAWFCIICRIQKGNT